MNMKRVILAAPLLAILVATSSCVQKTRPIAADARDELEAELTPARCDQILDELLPGMGAESIVAREQPQKRFEQLCLAAARPGRGNERRTLCTAIGKRLGPETAEPARVWMLRQLANIGGEESISRLAELLDDPDLRIRELSRRALQNIPSIDAARVLVRALERADNSDWRVALINAVGAHPSTPEHVASAGLTGRRSAYHTLSVLLGNENAVVASAALAALSDIGKFTLVHWRTVSGAGDSILRSQADAALLRYGEQLVARGHGAAAAKVYDELYQSSAALEMRSAALHGLVVTRGEEVVPLLLGLIAGDDPRLATTAARFAEEIPGSAATQMLVDAFGDSSPAAKVLLLETFAARGDVAARPTVIAAVTSDDAQVRIAALRALQHLGDSSTVVLLAEAGARSAGDEREAARESLNRLPGQDVNESILAALQAQSAPAVRCELIKSLAARWCWEAMPALFETTGDTDESVRVAAFEALGALATGSDLPMLVERLIATVGDDARTAAENAVVETALRIEDGEQRAEPVLAVLGDTGEVVKASLIRVLGRIGGERALEAIRAARADGHPVVVDATVRALAKWPTLEVTADLLEIARNTTNDTHRVLALRGYVRLVRLPSDREPVETFELLVEAMALSTRPEEKKLVLGGLADVRHIYALKMAELLLEEEPLRDEAATATLAIARALAAEDRGAALEAIENVRTTAAGEKIQQQVDEVAEFIKRFEGYSAAWVISGPYMEEGKKSADVFAMVFPPERLDALDVVWTPLAVNNRANPWIFDLARAVGGESRCVYVRTSVWSERQQPARLEIGSDDAVKAWLNSELVHSNLVSRGLTPGEDHVAVTLNEGWNALMLKIVQGGGAWGFCAGLKAPDGSPLAGLDFEAE